jgi:DNA-binding MarR family transcriptional regulator
VTNVEGEQTSRRADEQLGRDGATARRRGVEADEAAILARSFNPSGSLGEAPFPQPGVAAPGDTANRDQEDRKRKTKNGKRKTKAKKRKPKDQQPKTNDHACAAAWQALRLAHDRVERQLTTELGQHCGLAISDFDVLLHLHLHAAEEVRMLDLTEAVLLSQPALSRLVARLVERGLLERTPAGDDGRAIVVCLTDQGRKVAGRAVQVHTTAVHDILASRLSPREQDSLLQTLTRITG